MLDTATAAAPTCGLAIGLEDCPNAEESNSNDAAFEVEPASQARELP